MNKDLAERLIGAAIAMADQDFRRPVSVAICDGHGFLAGFLRMDGAPLRSIDIALGKAYTASRVETDTDAFQDRLRRETLTLADFCDTRLTTLAGGAVLKDAAGEVIGGLGISGLTPPEDMALAKALARTILPS